MPAKIKENAPQTTWNFSDPDLAFVEIKIWESQKWHSISMLAIIYVHFFLLLMLASQFNIRILFILLDENFMVMEMCNLTEYWYQLGIEISHFEFLGTSKISWTQVNPKTKEDLFLNLTLRNCVCFDEVFVWETFNDYG